MGRPADKEAQTSWQARARGAETRQGAGRQAGGDAGALAYQGQTDRCDCGHTEARAVNWQAEAWKRARGQAGEHAHP